MYEDLKNHLLVCKSRLEGNWILNNSGYEDDICRLLEMKREGSRYYDASWQSYFIEFKKGKSIWLDLVRYSEIVLKANNDSLKETITLFFPNSRDWKRIENIFAVETKKIIKEMALDEEIANTIVKLKDHIPRSLNAQASLTLKDVKRLAEFVI